MSSFIWLVLGLSFSVLLNGAFVYVLFKGSKKLLQFDDLYELLVHDLETNLKFFNKLANTPVLGNSPEILEAHQNMRIIRDRLMEYILRMEELSNRRLRRPEKKRPGPPPVVV